jgi:hypothetical protein
MALDKGSLQTAIKNLLDDMTLRNESATDEFAQRLATAIDTFVRGGQVTVASGIPVSTAGTAAAQTGATTGPGNGTIS